MYQIKCVGILIALLGAVSLAKAISYSQIGDMKIVVDGTEITCDQLICPAGTTSCLATEQQDPTNPNLLQRIDICYGSNNQTLDKSNKTEKAYPPYSNVNSTVLVTSNGQMSNSNYAFSPNLTDQQMKTEFEAHIEQVNKEVQQQLSNMNKHFHQEMEQFNNQMQEMQNNLNHQMQEMQNNLNNMFG